MRNYNTSPDEEGIPANVPMRHYMPSDRIELPQPAQQPACARAAVPYINVPGPDQTWKELNQWRMAYGLPPVVELIG
jgi:hypothetical protein